VILLGEKSRVEHNAKQPWFPIEQLAVIFCGRLGDAIDVFGIGLISSLAQATGPPAGRVHRRKTLVALVKTNDSTSAAATQPGD
jgi:hypothetical protein